MLKIYCDNGGFLKELSKLEREGKIQIYQFRYENKKNRRIRHMAAPSCPTWSELKHPWSELDRPWADFGKTSDKRHAIEVLLRDNLLDAKHLDSAYMEGCKAFLTSDKGDIVSRRNELRLLLGIEVFHFHEDWNEFLAFVAERG